MTDALFGHASCSGLYRLTPAQRQAMPTRLQQAGLQALTIDLHAAKSLPKLLAALARPLAFPDWYGNNLDALRDCLTDPQWQAGKPVALLFDGLATFGRKHPAALADFLDVLDTATRERAQDGKAIWILFDAPFATLAACPEA